MSEQTDFETNEQEAAAEEVAINEAVVIEDIEDEPLSPVYAITSYGVDYDVEGLVRRIDRGDISIPPFQRRFVWNLKRSSRFIESLLLGLPVPGIFLSKEKDSNRLLVIDGQQRLRSLYYFYKGGFGTAGTKFKLKGLASKYDGAEYDTLSTEEKRRLDDSILHATVVRQDRPNDGESSIFLIFERLNTGGNQLQAQEIRVALFHGEFNELLNSLNENDAWRALYGPHSQRKKDQELILRFFALYFNIETYKPPMKEFLNNFMGANQHLQIHSAQELTSVFETAITAVRDFLGSNAFKPKRSLNAAVFDSVMLGVSRRLTSGPITDGEKLLEQYSKLFEDDQFTDAITVSMADEAKVKYRINRAIELFRQVP